MDGDVPSRPHRHLDIAGIAAMFRVSQRSIVGYKIGRVVSYAVQNPLPDVYVLDVLLERPSGDTLTISMILPST